MEIMLDRNVYPKTGTKEIICSVEQPEGKLTLHTSYIIGVLHNTYVLERNFHRYYLDKSDVTTHDSYVDLNKNIVSDPRNMDACDWQLLKIIHSEIDNKTWNVYYIIKDFIDNRINEDDTLDQIKEILDKGE